MQVEKVDYDINWRKFKRGYSFFIPCLEPRAAKKQVREVCKRLKYRIVIKVVIEEGIKGLRVWRV